MLRTDGQPSNLRLNKRFADTLEVGFFLYSRLGGLYLGQSSVYPVVALQQASSQDVTNTVTEAHPSAGEIRQLGALFFIAHRKVIPMAKHPIRKPSLPSVKRFPVDGYSITVDRADASRVEAVLLRIRAVEMMPGHARSVIFLVNHGTDDRPAWQPLSNFIVEASMTGHGCSAAAPTSVTTARPT